jgi:hypothetical protein
MPALLARPNNDVAGESIFFMHRGSRVQIGSTRSSTISAVFEAFTLTGTGSGAAGMTKPELPPLCAVAGPVYIALATGQ